MPSMWISSIANRFNTGFYPDFNRLQFNYFCFSILPIMQSIIEFNSYVKNGAIAIPEDFISVVPNEVYVKAQYFFSLMEALK